jgi:hypothetical protein
MTPEILQRCESCGATIREPAMFCPECGKAIGTPNAAQTDENKATTESHHVVVNEAVNDAANPPVTSPANPEDKEHYEAEKDAPAIASTAPSLAGTEILRSGNEEKHGARERTRETLHRASNVARGAIEGNVKRVEKIHHVSSVMFEEAHYDPSLRFVLVALGLFVMFIILLVLSKVMG